MSVFTENFQHEKIYNLNNLFKKLQIKMEFWKINQPKLLIIIMNNKRY